jgi:hypothetical protein
MKQSQAWGAIGLVVVSDSFLESFSDSLLDVFVFSDGATLRFLIL